MYEETDVLWVAKLHARVVRDGEITLRLEDANRIKRVIRLYLIQATNIQKALDADNPGTNRLLSKARF